MSNRKKDTYVIVSFGTSELPKKYTELNYLRNWKNTTLVFVIVKPMAFRRTLLLFHNKERTVHVIVVSGTIVKDQMNYYLIIGKLVLKS